MPFFLLFQNLLSLCYMAKSSALFIEHEPAAVEAVQDRRDGHGSFCLFRNFLLNKCLVRIALPVLLFLFSSCTQY